jgi:muramidase (phage lysozyme)
MTPAEALRSANVRAFLAALKFGEGTSGPNGYRTMFGGELFDNNFVDHPRKAITKTLGGKPITSTAAGAYQHLSRTWDAQVKQWHFPDFSPESQDQAAAALIMGRGAMPALLAGRVEEAARLCNREWASLPESPYGQPTVTMAQFVKHYTDAGGSLTAQSEEKPVLPFLPIALSALFEVIPPLLKTLGSGTERSEKNIKAAEFVVGVAKTAVNAVNEQDLVDKLKNDPAAVAQVREAIERQWFVIVDMADVTEARKADLAFVQSGARFWYSPAFWIAVLLLPLVYMLVGAVVGIWGVGFSQDVRSTLAGSISGLIVGSLVGFYYGGVAAGNTTNGMRKTDASPTA